MNSIKNLIKEDKASKHCSWLVVAVLVVEAERRSPAGSAVVAGFASLPTEIAGRNEMSPAKTMSRFLAKESPENDGQKSESPEIAIGGFWFA